MTSCHDVLYGLHCVNKVVLYINQNPAFADDRVAKKIFINTYNCSFRLDAFCETGKSLTPGK